MRSQLLNGRTRPGRSFRLPDIRRAAPLLLAGVILGGGVIGAQDSSPPLPPVERPPTSGADQRGVQRLQPFDSGSPFDRGPVLRSYQLRGLRPDVVARLLGAEEGGRLPLEVLALPTDSSDDEGTQVELFVEIDGASFLNRNQAQAPRVEVYAYVLAAGRVVSHLAEMFVVNVSDLGEAIWQSGLKFYGGVELPPGKYELRILVRNAASGAVGIRSLALTVPGADAGGTLPPLVFREPEARDAWLSVPSKSSNLAEAGNYPFKVGDRALSPAARAVLVTGRRAEAILFHRDGGRVQLPEVGVVELMPEAGAPEEGSEAGSRLVTTAEAVVRQAPGDTAEPRAHQVEFLPPAVAPGLYRIRLVTREPSARVSSWTPVAVIGAETQERDLLWSDIRWMLSTVPVGGEEVAKPEADLEGAKLSRRERSGRAVRQLSQRYREVLRKFGLESLDRATTALFEMESEALGRGDRKAALRLREAELAVARELGEKDARALLPLIHLHGTVGERYRGRRIFSLAAHAQSMVEILAEQHAEFGGTRALTANALASQAGNRQQAKLLSSSRRLFVRALEHDPGNVSALLGLAASYEKYAEYNFAIEQLKQLAAELPESDEAVLRLAINQMRVGLVPRAREALQVVVDRDRGDWIWELAIEELARTYLIAENLGDAERVLETALSESPHASGIRFLLGHVYDRRGRVDRSLDLLNGVSTERSDRASARRRYDEWPRRLLDEARVELRSSARAVMSDWEKLLGGSDE